MPSRQEILRWLPVLLVFGFAATMLWGYVTNDTWIHLRYAKHFIERGELSFNPGVPSYGATSPLWIFGLVMLLKLGAAPILSTKILGVLSGLLAMALASRLIRRLDIPDGWYGWVMGLVVLDAWFQRWTFSGMETPLAGALLLVLLMPALSRARVPWLVWGAAAGMAALCRPEFSLLAVGAVPWLVWRERRHHPEASSVRGVLLAVAGWMLVYGPWLAYAWSAFGRFTPETAAAKSYGLTFDPLFLAGHLFSTLKQFGMVQGFLYLAVIYIGVRYAAVWRGRDGAVRAGARLTTLTGVTLTWLAILAGGYAVKQVWIISRYVSPLLVPLLLTMAGWAGLMVPRAPKLGHGAKRVLVVCAVMAMTTNAFVLNQLVRPHAESFSRGVETCFYKMGEWLADNTPDDTVIAAHDIGALGYASERRILDLAGLVSPEILELGREMGFEAMVESGVWLTAEVPDYVYDRTQGLPRWENAEMYGVTFELVAQCQVDGVGLRESGPWTYALYRLHDRAAPSP